MEGIDIALNAIHLVYVIPLFSNFPSLIDLREFLHGHLLKIFPGHHFTFMILIPLLTKVHLPTSSIFMDVSGNKQNLLIISQWFDHSILFNKKNDVDLWRAHGNQGPISTFVYYLHIICIYKVDVHILRCLECRCERPNIEKVPKMSILTTLT